MGKVSIRIIWKITDEFDEKIRIYKKEEGKILNKALIKRYKIKIEIGFGLEKFKKRKMLYDSI